MIKRGTHPKTVNILRVIENSNQLTIIQETHSVRLLDTFGKTCVSHSLTIHSDGLSTINSDIMAMLVLCKSIYEILRYVNQHRLKYTLEIK